MRRFLVIILTAALLLTTAGCTLFGSKTPNTPDPTAEQIKLVLYFGDKSAEYLEREERVVAKESGATAAEQAVRELIKGPADPTHVKTVPPEARLLGIKVEDGIAYVNFSREMQTKHWGGTTGELFTTYSVVNTLTEDPAITKVQFLIEGQVDPSIWGHGETDKPISRNDKLIR
jgi:spore germination protein GerM